MKKIKIVFVISFFLILVLPMIFITRGKDITSKIDNRMLTNNPFSKGFVSSGDRTQDIDNFLTDRIGFRDKMILTYTVLNDVCFREMVHPIYMYGEDGYIFGKAGENKVYSEFDTKFADFVKKAQTYCEERNIPFTFVFDPSKNSVMTDKLRKGYDYNNLWVDRFMKDLDERKVSYVDNLALLKSLYEQGTKVFNQKYNAGHWNDLGAFYGVNNIIKQFEDDFDSLKPNQLSEFNMVEEIRTSLPVSEFPIHESEIIFEAKDQFKSVSKQIYNEIELDQHYRWFGYYQNEEKVEAQAPRVLVFQGSYMNGMGYKFFQNAFAEYIFVHDYQNVINLDYYINLFQPDCVVFETAEYTLYETYYNSAAMEATQFNPGLSTIPKENQIRTKVFLDQFTAQTGQSITVLSMPLEGHEQQYVYLKINDQIYDLDQREDQLEVSILNDNLNHTSNMELIYVNK